MKYTLVASSRSRSTEVYRGENGQLVEVFYFKSGRTGYRPVSGIDSSLTVHYQDSQEFFEGPEITQGFIESAHR